MAKQCMLTIVDIAAAAPALGRALTPRLCPTSGHFGPMLRAREGGFW